jgi:hypothetical protein
MEERRNGYEPTPAEEEAFFARNPELGKAMEALRDEEPYRRMERLRREAEEALAGAREALEEMERH